MREKGFSFLELLLATLLMTIGLIGIVNAFSVGFSQSGEAKNFMVAKNLAESKLEEVRNLSYPGVVPEVKAPVSDFGAYQRQVQVLELQSGLKQIEIDVFWQVKGGETNISIYSLVSDI